MDPPTTNHFLAHGSICNTYVGWKNATLPNIYWTIHSKLPPVLYFSFNFTDLLSG